MDEKQVRIFKNTNDFPVRFMCRMSVVGDDPSVRLRNIGTEVVFQLSP